MAIAPVVNINGTSKRDLIDQNLEAWRAVKAAFGALAEAAPHPRDFQTVQDPTVLAQARVDHKYRLHQLNKIASELEEIAIKIQEQGR